MKRRVFIVLSLILLAIMLMGTGVVFGIFINEQEKLEGSNQATVTRIAVVNADTGIEKNGKMINYASDFMAFPNDEFILTGYTDGEQGLYYDKYAAVILIPTTFSSSIESINGRPQKTQINYKLNPNLRADIRIKTEKDVVNFINQLSNNISYIYVESILTEVHEVQDQSANIMSNDIKDLKKILGIEAGELIAETDYTPIELVDREITPMDLSDNYSRVGRDVEGITSGYNNSVEKARSDLADIKANEQGLNDAINSAMNSMADANPFKNTGDISGQMNDVAEKGKTLNESFRESKQEALKTVSGNAVSLSVNKIFTGMGDFKETLSQNGISVNPQEVPYNYMYDIQELVYELAKYFKDSWTADIADYDLSGLGQDLNYVSKNSVTRTGTRQTEVRDNNAVSENTVSDNAVNDYEDEYSDETMSQNTVSVNDALLGETENETSISEEEMILNSENIKNLLEISNDLGELKTFVKQNQMRMEYYAQRHNYIDADEKQVRENIVIDIDKAQNSVRDCLGHEGSELTNRLNTAYDDLSEIYREMKIIKEMAEDDNRDTGENKISRVQVRQDIEKLWKLISEYRNTSLNAVNDIEVSEEAIDEFNEAVTNAGKSISDGFSKGAGQYGKACESFSKVAQDFIRLLFEYDALKYMDSETQSAYLKDMYETITEMEKSIVEQDVEYTEYVIDVNETAMKNATNLQKNIDEKNEMTSQNIGEMVDDLKESRTEINEDNIEILTGITTKLPYTRLGSLNYTQVYSMVSDPVMANDVSDDVVKSYMEEIKIGLPKLLTIMGMITLFVILMTLIGVVIYNKDKKAT